MSSRSGLDIGEIVEEPIIPVNGSKVKSPVLYDDEDTIVVPAEDLSEDTITLSIKDDELPDAVLKAVLLGLSEEQEALKKLRERQGADKDTSKISHKRGTLLKYMSETLIQRQALIGGTGDLDLRGPKFREIIKMFFGIISDTFDQINIPPEYKSLFFQALSGNLEGWETKAEKIIKAIR
jgi:hypothetical protein